MSGIVANGNSYPTYRILQIFKKTLGLNVSIVCESDRSGNVYIAEVHQCVDISGTMQKDVTMTPSFPIWDFNQIKIPNNNTMQSQSPNCITPSIYIR